MPCGSYIGNEYKYRGMKGNALVLYLLSDLSVIQALSPLLQASNKIWTRLISYLKALRSFAMDETVSVLSSKEHDAVGSYFG